MNADFSSNKINGKIQEAETAKAHTIFVIGSRDMEAGNVSVRLHGKGNLDARRNGEVIRRFRLPSKSGGCKFVAPMGSLREAE